MLSYPSVTATQAAEQRARKLKPDWMIGISFGALVTLALARRGRVFFRAVKGIVLLGPTTRGGMRRVVPDKTARKKAIVDHRVKYDSRLANDFFETAHAADYLIAGIKYRVRLIRGEKDIYNSTSGFRMLCDRYWRNQRGKRIETVEIPGATHVVLPSQVTIVARGTCLKALFGKIL